MQQEFKLARMRPIPGANMTCLSPPTCRPVAGLRVLLVDDLPTTRRILHAGLREEGCAVREAADGLEALAAVEAETPDAIIADVLMPRMDGFALCRRLRAHERFKSIPFIVYTSSYNTAGDQKTAYAMGADDFIVKPAHLDVLLDSLRRVTDPEHRRVALEREPASELVVMEEFNAALVRELEEKNTELAQKVESLVRAEQRLRLQSAALENAASAILITNVDGVIEWINPAFTLLTGFAAEEALGCTPQILKSGAHEPAFHAEFWRILKAGQTWRGVFVNRRKDGTRFHGESTVTPVRADSGEITHYVSIMSDVTARKRADDELQESERRYRYLFTHHPMPMWVFDVETLRFLAVNDVALAQYGYTREEFLAMTLRDIRPEEDVPLLLEHLRGRPLPDYEWRHRRKDGSILYVQVVAETVEFARREARLVTVLDVTARHEAEQALRQAEAKYRRIFEDSIEGLYQTTPDGRFVSANPALAQMLGYATPEELVNDRADIARQSYVQPQRREEFKRLIAERGFVRDFQYEVQRKGGGTIWVAENARAVRDAEGRLLYYEGSMIDITERKKLTNELLRSQRMESVGRLASGIAHDMNNILAPIMMAAPLLRMPLRPADVAKTLETIESSARRGADLVRQLLLFGRGVEGGRGPVDSAKLVREMARMAAETFPKNISVVTEVAPGVWPMCGDVSQLHQVLLNLCVNARDAMPQGGSLKIAAANVEFSAGATPPLPDAKPGSYVALTVVDTGTGIPSEIADRIFDPFFTTKEAGQGTGLGLSTVIGLVKSHGGFLNLRSAINQGTTFEIFVPAMPGATEAPPPVSAAPARGQRELILVVDDEESIRDVLRAALTRHNYRVLVATDGAEASALFARHASDVSLVVTDIDMPFMDGIKLIKLVRQLNPAVKILVSSGIGMGKGPGDRSGELRAVGIESILAKPYTIEEVLGAVHVALVAR